jgi:branched-chain amino acid transport system ATP-binding protein
MSALLQIRDLHAGYGSASVVRSFDLQAEQGSVVAVLGPNGAGKTTLMLTIAGILPRISGELLLDGRPLACGRPVVANRLGVVLVPDDRALFPTLSVKENLHTACRKRGPKFDDVLSMFPALRARWNLPAGQLSGGEQQMLAVGRALVQEPRVLLIDEMSMGLAPIVVQSLLPIVRDVADRTGAVVILVEQHIQLALDVADQALVLVHGDVSLRGAALELKADPTGLEAAYLGSSAGTAEKFL